jgi:hypothetical protein
VIISDGLVFLPYTHNMGRQVHVLLECRSENDKIVCQRWIKPRMGDHRGDPTAEEIAEGIAAMEQWFKDHTRPRDEKDRASTGHPKRPYKPAGFLRRLNDEELELPHYAEAKRV